MPLCRYRIFSFFWWSLEWWGAQCYFWAVVAYNTSSIATIIADCIYIEPSVAVCHGLSRCEECQDDVPSALCALGRSPSLSRSSSVLYSQG